MLRFQPPGAENKPLLLRPNRNLAIGDRRAAWLDDEPGWDGQEWVKNRLARGIPTLLVVPRQTAGFIREHVELLRAFSVSLRS